MASVLDMIDEAIANLESKLNLAPGGSPPGTTAIEQSPKKEQPPTNTEPNKSAKEQTKKKTVKKQKQAAPPGNNNRAKKGGAPSNPDQPAICKLEFKVGIIEKVWVHPDADKLYCEEINCGEDKPRQIASGLRAHYDEAGMLNRRVLVISNLKAKNLVGFKSFGMVLCAAETQDDGSEKVEFVEPPENAPPGEIISFEGLPTPEPVSASQVEKKKVFQSCMDGMKTTDDCFGAWNGHVFMTSAGPCKAQTIKGGAMR